jgi:cytochrome c
MRWVHLREIRLVAALGLVVAVTAALVGTSAYALDAKAAKKLARKSGCLKCHSISKEKDAPPLKEISAKYKEEADAENKLYTHLTTNPTVEVDGKKEKHEGLETDDEAKIRNVVQWILSL